MKKLILILMLIPFYLFGQADSTLVELQTKTTIADTDILLVSGTDTVYFTITYAALKTLLNAIYEAQLVNSAGLRGALDDETGTGLAVFGTSPTFVTSIVMGSADLSEAELEIIDGGTLTTTELNYVDGVTSDIQTQINTLPTVAEVNVQINTMMDDSSLTASVQGGIPYVTGSPLGWAELTTTAFLDSIFQTSPIVETDLNVTNSPTDNYILSYNSAASNFTWVVDATGGSPATADITDVSVTQTEFAELETIGTTSIGADDWTALSTLPADIKTKADTLTYSWGVMDTVITGDLIGYKVESNITIVKVSSYTDANTTTFNLEERVGTTPNTAGTDAMASDLVADNNQQESTSFTNGDFAKDTWICPTVSATGDVARFGITVFYIKQSY